MTDRNAAVALRVLGPRASALGTGDSDSLQNIDTTELPNGSLCWVISNETLYVLKKGSTDAASGESIIVPASGPGRWVALTGAALAFAGHMSVYNKAVPTLEIGLGNEQEWFALPDSGVGGPYLPQVTPTGAFWSISATTGVATYSGPPAVYQFNANLVVSVDGGPSTIGGTLSLNGAFIGGTLSPELEMDVGCASVDDHTAIALAIEMALVPGDTVQFIVRNSTDDAILVGQLQITGILVALGAGTNAFPAPG